MATGWIAASVILCTFGFLREMRPLEPFAVEYLVTSKNITMEEVNQLLMPAVTYSYLVQLFIVFLITDYLR